jgi:hypothetical protein
MSSYPIRSRNAFYPDAIVQLLSGQYPASDRIRTQEQGFQCNGAIHLKKSSPFITSYTSPAGEQKEHFCLRGEPVARPRYKCQFWNLWHTGNSMSTRIHLGLNEENLIPIKGRLFHGSREFHGKVESKSFIFAQLGLVP